VPSGLAGKVEQAHNIWYEGYSYLYLIPILTFPAKPLREHLFPEINVIGTIRIREEHLR
jgi:hypothetical protein